MVRISNQSMKNCEWILKGKSHSKLMTACSQQHHPEGRTRLATVLTDEQMIDTDNSSYHWEITENEAKKRLNKFEKHCYLTRWSPSTNSFVLTVYQKPRHLKHFKIILIFEGNVKKHMIEGKNESFVGLEELLTHYEGHTIDPAFANIGKRLTLEAWNSMWCTIL